MAYLGCLPLVIVFLLFILLPFFFANFLLAALGKLGLSPEMALLAVVGMLFGGTIDIPIKRIPRDETVFFDPFAVFGFGRMFPGLLRTRRYTTLAVNLGGCLVPCVLAVYEITRVIQQGPHAALVLLLVSVLNIVVCYRMARPTPGIGILMPGLIPPLFAAIPTILLIPDFAPPVAFVAGVLGPLVGADLLHLSEVKNIATGTASIGGAGTFDGIVLSGLFAALLA